MGNHIKLELQEYCKIENHRTTELFELEGTLKGHLVQLPCSEQGHLQLNQVAQSLVQLTLNISEDEESTIIQH